MVGVLADVGTTAVSALTIAATKQVTHLAQPDLYIPSNNAYFNEYLQMIFIFIHDFSCFFVYCYNTVLGSGVDIGGSSHLHLTLEKICENQF